ncbi:MAG: fibronectin type III-like domain-contianing protein, partial [Clostridia bacterium]|nr:fibronectin type III-like domain-contianing protein [Clostridia bacterium]
LKAFKRVTLAAGESKNVEFELSYGDLGYYDERGEYTVEKGKTEVFIGENCLTENGITVETI